MNSFKITVFTEPVSAVGFIPRLKSLLRPIKYFLEGKKIPKKYKYGGHPAVTRSVMDGLQKIGTEFNYNPVLEEDIAENVIVLAGIDRTREMIELKREGKIRKLFAGPNVCESPREENNLLGSKEIDVCIVPSKWVKSFFIEEENSLREKIWIWCAGVNTNYWQPSSKKKDNDVIIYWKTEAVEFYSAIEDIVRRHNYNPILIKYGDYSTRQYKTALDKALFAVFISRSESQGIAMTEAWSMDVPVYAWDPGEFFYKNRNYKEVTSCPYLTEDSGLKWIELDELNEIIAKTRRGYFSFQPRKYVMRSFSDQQCALQLVDKFKSWQTVPHL